MAYRRLLLFITISLALLTIPFIAMQFTNEVNWSTFDFIVMGILLIGLSILVDFSLRKIKNKKLRAPIIISIILAFILLWLELAIGVFGTPIGGS